MLNLVSKVLVLFVSLSLSLFLSLSLSVALHLSSSLSHSSIDLIWSILIQCDVWVLLPIIPITLAGISGLVSHREWWVNQSGFKCRIPFRVPKLEIKLSEQHSSNEVEILWLVGNYPHFTEHMICANCGIAYYSICSAFISTTYSRVFWSFLRLNCPALFHQTKFFFS